MATWMSDMDRAPNHVNLPLNHRHLFQLQVPAVELLRRLAALASEGWAEGMGVGIDSWNWGQNWN